MANPLPPRLPVPVPRWNICRPTRPTSIHIEKMWSKVKEFLRAAKARTSDALDAAIATAFQSVTPQDAASWFASCGYTI